MIKNQLFLTAISSAVLFGFVGATAVNADCSAYGNCGGNGKNLIIDKQVGLPESGNTFTSVNYIDNLSTKDTRFKTNQHIFFKLRVKNTSDKVMQNVSVTDTLPKEVSFIEGSDVYLTNGQDITVTSKDLQPNEERIYYIKTGVKNANVGTTCAINKVYAKASINGVVQEDSDNSQFCIQNDTNKRFEGLNEFPKTGPELAIALGLGQVGLLFAGLKMRKISK
jgi:uncharacterized repeat protein (TIGR01451 family)